MREDAALSTEHDVEDPFRSRIKGVSTQIRALAFVNFMLFMVQTFRTMAHRIDHEPNGTKRRITKTVAAATFSCFGKDRSKLEALHLRGGFFT